VAPVAEHTRGGSRHDVARFLTEHESCASDFQIRRFEPERGGSGGALSVVCNGCGERAGYELGEPGELKAVDSEGGETPPGEGRVSRDQLERWLPAPAALPWWVPNAYIVAVILVGLAMIAFGVVREREGQHLFGGQGSSGQPEQEQADSDAPDRAEPEPAPPATAQTGAGAAGEDRKDSDGDRPDRIRAELDPVTVLNRFRIGVPGGWSGGMSGGAVVFRPASDEAEVRVFLESGAQPNRRLSREAKEFLEDAHPGAKSSDPERLRLGGDKAIRQDVYYAGGAEWATVLSASGYSYLILCRVDRGAPGQLRRQAEAALASFQAL
jgi:hypothetical protein